jgi:predicted nuclease of predicted toxin-antitoxin system
MKILIDECLPDALKENIAALGHECQSVRKAGFGSKKNGELLTLAEAHWDVLLTSDRNIKYQQNMTGAASLHLDSVRKVKSHDGFVASYASVCSSLAFY